jgi:hypothetical protein
LSTVQARVDAREPELDALRQSDGLRGKGTVPRAVDDRRAGVGEDDGVRRG